MIETGEIITLLKDVKGFKAGELVRVKHDGNKTIVIGNGSRKFDVAVLKSDIVIQSDIFDLLEGEE